MNVQDIAEIRNRARALHDWLPRLDALTALRRDGKLMLADALEITLTSAQQAAIKTRAETLAGRLRSLAGSLPQPTSLTGTANGDAVAQTERDPTSFMVTLANLIEGQLNPLLGISLSEQPDGTFGFEFEPADAQQIADLMATTRDQANVLIGVLEARLGQ